MRNQFIEHKNYGGRGFLNEPLPLFRFYEDIYARPVPVHTGKPNVSVLSRYAHFDFWGNLKPLILN